MEVMVAASGRRLRLAHQGVVCNGAENPYELDYFQEGAIGARGKDRRDAST